MKTGFLAALVAAIFLIGCGSGEKKSGEANEVWLDPELSSRLHLGRMVFQQHCAECHDSNGDGRPFRRGSNLRKIAKELTPERVRVALDEGRNEMPAFPMLSDAHKTGVAEFLLREVLADARE